MKSSAGLSGPKVLKGSCQECYIHPGTARGPDSATGLRPGPLSMLGLGARTDACKKYYVPLLSLAQSGWKGRGEMRSQAWWKHMGSERFPWVSWLRLRGGTQGGMPIGASPATLPRAGEANFLVQSSSGLERRESESMNLLNTEILRIHL